MPGHRALPEHASLCCSRPPRQPFAHRTGRQETPPADSRKAAADAAALADRADRPAAGGAGRVPRAGTVLLALSGLVIAVADALAPAS